jgi:hypothetical protein
MSDDKNAPNSTIEQFLYGKASEQDKDDMNNEKTYRLTSEKPRRMIRLEREDGSYYSVHYTDIFTLEGNPTGEFLSLLVKGSAMWHLEGKNLKRLADMIEEWRVPRLYVYNPEVHNLSNATDPIITSISEEQVARKPALYASTPAPSPAPLDHPGKVRA